MNTRTKQELKPLQIGSVTLENPFILAPMAGVTDLPFRILCSRLGAGMNC
ncbi:MAG: tRNA-dihydrouridine synthase, partial [Lachnospiraceae bacterium]|nr:tRNA-dihydrouridine synthase [Lachnospiraceae bacterium]